MTVRQVREALSRFGVVFALLWKLLVPLDRQYSYETLQRI